MARWIKVLFLVHMVVAAVPGALLLIAPGRFLDWLGWAPVDPLLSRVLGAALLALAWSSFRGWRASGWSQVVVVIEMEVAFTLLGAIGLLRHLVIANYPWMVWTLLAILAAFAVAWVVAWLKH